MRSSNPVLTRLTPTTQPGYRSPAGYGQAAETYPVPSAPLRSAPLPSAISTPTIERMTVDDVVVRTVALLAATGVSAALAWAVVPMAYTMPVWIGAMVIGLIVGVIIAIKQITNPAAVLAYAVIEGVFLSMVSRTFNYVYPGIVVQAVIGTFGVFFVMAFLYRARVIRATPKFVRIVTGALAGVFALMVINLVLSIFGVTTGLRGNADGSVGWVAYAFSLVCIVVAALTFVLDFDEIERGVRAGRPRQDAWSSAFGLLVGLVWLYLEILRFLSYLRGNN